MSGDLIRDTKNIPMPGFAPTRIVTVANGGTFTPGVDDRAFRVPSDTTYQINAAGVLGQLRAGMTTVIVPGQTYLLTTGMNIEVM